jgi:hypothetical protein
MAGNSDQKIQARGGAAPLGYCFDRHGCFSEVNSRGIRRKRDIQPVVDQNASRRPARFADRKTSNLNKSARLQSLLANLNPARSSRNRTMDRIAQRKFG